MRIVPPFPTAGQRVVEAIDKHGSLCFLDGHHHPLPQKHKLQLDNLGREMVVDEVPLSCFVGFQVQPSPPTHARTHTRTRTPSGDRGALSRTEGSRTAGSRTPWRNASSRCTRHGRRRRRWQICWGPCTTRRDVPWAKSPPGTTVGGW
jgi:hypothetical protein